MLLFKVLFAWKYIKIIFYYYYYYYYYYLEFIFDIKTIKKTRKKLIWNEKNSILMKNRFNLNVKYIFNPKPNIP